jgi:hypothetical protein
MAAPAYTTAARDDGDLARQPKIHAG